MFDNRNDSYTVERGIYDDKGERAFKVLYLEKRKACFWLMIGLSIVWLCCGAGLIVYAYSTGEPSANRVELFGLLVIWPAFVLIIILVSLYKSLYFLNTRVELYRHHFIYRNAFGMRKSYSYNDCISRHEKRYVKAPSHYSKAMIMMKDGSKLTVDEQIINAGFGAAIGYWGLKKR
ncbi:MAG: hypothetical protein IKI64_11125 [Clostridia bacterium]|nr:hypothetical protein [Clostridia bacterium]